MANKKRKKVLISVVSIVTVLALGIGLWVFFAGNNAQPVFVYDFSFLGMTEYWGDTKESSGPVTTDRVQTVFLSSTQTVTEIRVQQGDTVKKGDVLLTFDTTLSDLALERKRLEVEKLKLQVEDAYDQLWQIQNMVPMVIPEPKPEEPEEVNLGTALKGDWQVVSTDDLDGSSKDTAMICWLKQDGQLDSKLYEALLQKAAQLQEKNAPPAATEPSVPETTPETTAPTTPETPPETTSENTSETTSENTSETIPETEPSVPAAPTDFYVIFKITDGNMSLGLPLTWQGAHIYKEAEGVFRFSFFDASGIPDTSIANLTQEEQEEPDIQIGSGYTASQIAQMRAEQEKAIRELEFNVKMAEADYKIMQTEVADGNIYAQFDGQVVSLLTEEEARQSGEPLVKISGGGGFYVSASVSELDKELLLIGQEVTINDWNTGNVYTGTVESIGDYPTDQYGYYGTGNPNVSYYPFTVFIDETADLMEQSYVSVMYAAAEADVGIYLENPYLREENGRHYVYAQGADGKLEKRFVTAGKSLWGSYTQILSGITAEDKLAFPYGKNVKAGADTVEGDLSDLYGY